MPNYTLTVEGDLLSLTRFITDAPSYNLVVLAADETSAPVLAAPVNTPVLRVATDEDFSAVRDLAIQAAGIRAARQGAFDNTPVTLRLDYRDDQGNETYDREVYMSSYVHGTYGMHDDLIRTVEPDVGPRSFKVARIKRLEVKV